ncbi:putative Protein kinase domain containing protein [Blattamonas nauphoetae]|uniref:non-specific serine/threonine protein kinase n=1 Tax=Blattamonas nauphoetae TaxID=2049346 RepID=A0ABQ9X4S3_9EUKA|nr:putative Protein kinase domain containing protein [Blattamonas nauphoetae]
MEDDEERLRMGRVLCEKHRYLTVTYDAFRSPTTDQVVLFMDYADRGNLHDIIKAIQSNGAPESLVKKIVFMIGLQNASLRNYIPAHGLTQLHANNFIHRDIKPDNVVLVYDPTASTVRTLISDYGLLRRIDDSYQSLGESPEALDEALYDQTLDIWSIGCITYELLQGKHPFQSTGYMSLRKKVDKPPPPITTQQLSKECQDFLNQTLQKDKNLRLSVSKGTLLSHPWLSDLNEQNTELSWDEFVSLSSPKTITQDVDVPRAQYVPKNMQTSHSSTPQNLNLIDQTFSSQKHIYSPHTPPNLSIVHTQFATSVFNPVNPTTNDSSCLPINNQQRLNQADFFKHNPCPQPYQTIQQVEQIVKQTIPRWPPPLQVKSQRHFPQRPTPFTTFEPFCTFPCIFSKLYCNDQGLIDDARAHQESERSDRSIFKDYRSMLHLIDAIHNRQSTQSRTSQILPIPKMNKTKNAKQWRRQRHRSH